jgi:hypothetical protein
MAYMALYPEGGNIDRMTAIQDRLLTRISGLKRDDMTGCWEKCIIGSFITFTLCQVYLELESQRWAWHVARMGENMNAYEILVGKPKRKRCQEDHDIVG